jgi:hypothetical protein
MASKLWSGMRKKAVFVGRGGRKGGREVGAYYAFFLACTGKQQGEVSVPERLNVPERLHEDAHTCLAARRDSSPAHTAHQKWLDSSVEKADFFNGFSRVGEVPCAAHSSCLWLPSAHEDTCGKCAQAKYLPVAHNTIFGYIHRQGHSRSLLPPTHHPHRPPRFIYELKRHYQ